MTRRAKNTKSAKNTETQKKYKLLALQNVFVATIAKILIISIGAYGAPLILTIFLWFFILKEQRWAFTAFKVLALIETLVGLYALVAFIGYVYRGNNPFACVVQIILSSSYFVSGLLLHKWDRR